MGDAVGVVRDVGAMRDVGVVEVVGDVGDHASSEDFLGRNNYFDVHSGLLIFFSLAHSLSTKTTFSSPPAITLRMCLTF